MSLRINDETIKNEGLRLSNSCYLDSTGFKRYNTHKLHTLPLYKFMMKILDAILKLCKVYTVLQMI